MAKYKGTGTITQADFKTVKWVGTTKGGQAVTIEFAKAINMGNIDWTFADKDDTVAQIVMTAVYSNTDEASESNDEPWTIEVSGTPTGAAEIMLGAGIFYVGGAKVGLTRGGGQLTVERTFREINADGDRGPVEGRIVLVDSRGTLTLNALQILSRLADLYPAIGEAN